MIKSNLNYINKTIEYDYIRFLSNIIIGSNCGVDLFSNESQLRKQIRETSLSSKFNTIFENLINHSETNLDISYLNLLSSSKFSINTFLISLISLSF